MSVQTNLLRNILCANHVKQGAACGNLQFVRNRKPRFEPRAPSKIYRVKEPVVKDPEESELYAGWARQYNTDMKSLRLYLIKHREKMTEFTSIQDQPMPMEQQLGIMTEKNNKFNETSKILRESAFEKLMEMEKLKQQRLKLREEREIEEMRSQAESRVLIEKEKFKEYILPDNLDDNIERLLNTRSDHNYPLSKRGKPLRKKSEKVQVTDKKQTED